MSLNGPVSRQPKLLARNILELAELAFPEGGFFVEAGGHDGITYSNTLDLDASKWSGLMIEPSPVSFALLRKNRPEVLAANVALVSAPDIKFIKGTFHSGSPMASAHPDLIPRDSRGFSGGGPGSNRPKIRDDSSIESSRSPDKGAGYYANSASGGHENFSD